jgi:hypothetical protein
VCGHLLETTRRRDRLGARTRSVRAASGGSGNPKLTSRPIVLFGIVLMLFAYGITFGFIVELDSGMRGRLLPWMQVDGVGELKLTFLQVIIVYLVIDYATDIARVRSTLFWRRPLCRPRPC